MAVERQDMFGDGTVSMEYYPHKRIELRVVGFKVVVSKPYGVNYYRNEATISSPLIQISTNATVDLNLQDLNLLNKAILRAIEILNNENDGLVIDKNFTINNKLVYKNDIPEEILNIHNSSKSKTLKSIPYKEIQQNCVYADDKGHKWMYLGEGWLLKDGARVNRCNGPGQPYSKYIYLNFDALENQVWDIKPRLNGSALVCQHGILIADSYATKKRLVKLVANYSNCPSINSVETAQFGELYRFEENKGKSYWR